MSIIALNEVSAVVLAGGKSRRMAGTDKLTLEFGGSTLLDRTIKNLSSQTKLVLLNSNNDAAAKEALGTQNITVVRDHCAGNAGPLDGIVSTMEWLRAHAPNCKWLLTAPVDCPFLPTNLLQALMAGLEKPSVNEVKIVLPTNGENKHYACALWATELALPARTFLDNGGRAIREFIRSQASIEVSFGSTEKDPFFNINTPEDYQLALKLLVSE